MANPRRTQRRRAPESEPEHRGGASGDDCGTGRAVANAGDGLVPGPRRRPGRRTGTGSAGPGVAQPRRQHGLIPSSGTEPTIAEPGTDSPGLPLDGVALGDSIGPRLEGLSGDERDGDEPGRHGADTGRPTGAASLPLFPPGPSDYDGWRRVLAVRPDLAPAVVVGESTTQRGQRQSERAGEQGPCGDELGRPSDDGLEPVGPDGEHEAVEPGVCGVADGLAYRVDRLRACGNGVVPIQAAVAFVVLGRRLGLKL